MSNRSLLKTVPNTEHDFEWYPTTDEIINCIKADMEISGGAEYPSILDCGAGDGRVLMALGGSKRYAIEKSRPLLDAMDRSIFVVGSEFQEQTLIDLPVDVLFSNPPYSQYENWATKIITEGNATTVYLVIPDRWHKVDIIQDAIKAREGKSSVIGSFDFLDADRKARAKVDIVKINLGYESRFNSSARVDPFTLWFENNFSIKANKVEQRSYSQSQGLKSELSQRIKGELVNGRDLVTVLFELYQSDLAKLIKTYKSLETVDADLLAELDVNLKGVREALKLKIAGLKDR
jgi:hypothetical protein